MERRTRIWIGLGTALLVSSTGADAMVLVHRAPGVDPASEPVDTHAAPVPDRTRLLVAQADASGEGGPGEGGGTVLGTITEFRLSSNDPDAFAYDAAAEVAGYTALVHDAYVEAHAAAEALRKAVEALSDAPSAERIEAARAAWSDARSAYLRTEAFQFYAGPVDGPGGPLPRLNSWPVDPATIDALIADTAQPLDFRALARLNSIEPPVRITTGLHVIEYLLWGADGALGNEAFAGEAGARRADYIGALSRLLVNDLGPLVAAWAPGVDNNYRASVEAMDQRNALGRAFNGMAVLLGYEIPLRRIGSGLFPANENFQPSPFSRTSQVDNLESFAGARQVYFGTGLDALVAATDVELAARIEAGFAEAKAALAAMDAPYKRFLAPANGTPERATGEAAVRALTDLAAALRRAGNRLGVLVVIPGM